LKFCLGFLCFYLSEETIKIFRAVVNHNTYHQQPFGKIGFFGLIESWFCIWADLANPKIGLNLSANRSSFYANCRHLYNIDSFFKNNYSVSRLIINFPLFSETITCSSTLKPSLRIHFPRSKITGIVSVNTIYDLFTKFTF
jgi:hypothetical protein